MNRSYTSWWSPSLGRDMELLVFGHAGTPILAFPSSMGRFHEWEDFGMVDALHHQLTHGLNQLICVDSVDHESFYNKHVDPYTRIQRHRQYERYVFDEVLPFVHHRGGDFVIAAGASFGAYHAANVVLKRPWAFGKLIAMSGAFDVKPFMDGFYDDNVYFCNPVDYLPGLDDAHTLEALRRSHLILTAGDHDPCKGANDYLSRLLYEKDISHTYHVLPGVFGHDWPWWRDLIQQHVG